MKTFVRVVLLAGTASVLIASVAPAWGSPDGAEQDEATAVSSAAETLRGKKRRPGCRRFCQQAGALGCEPCPPTPQDQQPVAMLRQTLDGTRDRIVKLRATCNLDSDCVGAIILHSSQGGEYGRADLRIPARAEARVPVWLSKKGMETLEEKGRDRNVIASVPLRRPVQTRSISEPITLLPPER